MKKLIEEWLNEKDEQKKEEKKRYLRYRWRDIDNDDLINYAYDLSITPSYVREDMEQFEWDSDVKDKAICVLLCDPINTRLPDLDSYDDDRRREFNEAGYYSLLPYLMEDEDIVLTQQNLSDIIELCKYDENQIYDILEKFHLDREVLERFLQKGDFYKNGSYDNPVFDSKFYYKLFTEQDMENYPDLILKYMNLSAIPSDIVANLNWKEFLKKEEVSNDRMIELVSYVSTREYKNSSIGVYTFDGWDREECEKSENIVRDTTYYDSDNDILYSNVWLYIMDLLVQYDIVTYSKFIYDFIKKAASNIENEGIRLYHYKENPVIHTIINTYGANKVIGYLIALKKLKASGITDTDLKRLDVCINFEK